MHKTSFLLLPFVLSLVACGSQPSNIKDGYQQPTSKALTEISGKLPSSDFTGRTLEISVQAAYGSSKSVKVGETQIGPQGSFTLQLPLGTTLKPYLQKNAFSAPSYYSCSGTIAISDAEAGVAVVREWYIIADGNAVAEVIPGTVTTDIATGVKTRKTHALIYSDRSLSVSGVNSCNYKVSSTLTHTIDQNISFKLNSGWSVVSIWHKSFPKDSNNVQRDEINGSDASATEMTWQINP